MPLLRVAPGVKVIIAIPVYLLYYRKPLRKQSYRLVHINYGFAAGGYLRGGVLGDRAVDQRGVDPVAQAVGRGLHEPRAVEPLRASGPAPYTAVVHYV